MAITSVFAHRTEGLPELEMRCARVGQRGVRGSQRSTSEVSCVDGAHGE